MLVVGQVIFLGTTPIGAANQPIGYLALLPLLWAGFRFGQRGALTAAFIASAIALWGTLHGFGPFAIPDPNGSLLLVQAFVGTITMTALVLAAVISERKRAEQRLQVQDAVSRVLAESPTLKEAGPKVLQALCETGGWKTGALWTVNAKANELSCAEIWHVPTMDLPEFERITRQSRFAPGIGLPGRVWSSGHPVWVRDVTKDTNFPRAPAAVKEGLHAAFCFPLRLGEDILGTIECFSGEVREPDENFLQMLAAVGSQLGQFLERKKAEEALRHNEELYRTVTESASDAIVTMDEDSTIVAVNRSAERIFGYERQEFMGQSLTMLMPERLRARHRAGLTRFLKSGQRNIPWEAVELPGLHKDGHEIPLEISFGKFVRDGKQFFTGILRDISERKRAEESLRQSEALFRQLADAMPQIVWAAQPDGHIDYYNRRWYEFTGFSEDYREENWKELLHPDDVERHVAVYFGCIRAERPYQIEYRFKDHQTGRYRWFLGRALPVRNESGKVIRWFGTCTDIDDLKRAEEAQGKLAAIVESSEDAIMGKNLEGIVTSWNASAERLFGYRAEEIIGRPITQIIPADLQDEENNILSRLRHGEPVEHYETVRVTKKGRPIDVSLTISPIRDTAGRVVGVSKTVRDITERKKTETELEKARAALRARADNLEQIVAERTQELRETIAELESFSYSISHDMRGPLRAMQGYASVLEQELKGKIGNEEWEYLRRIGLASMRLTSLVQDILSYSQVSRTKLQLAPIDLQALVLELVQQNPNLQPPLAELRVEGPLPIVLGHEAALTQVCSNLLGNAVKFVFPGTTPRIHIWAETENSRARIYIADNGIGIEPKNHERIFQMFERVNSPKDYDGTGIGLAIVKKAVERMGGTLGVKSDLGQGSAFWFELRCISP